MEKMNEICDYLENEWSFCITTITNPLGNLIEKIKYRLLEVYCHRHSHRDKHLEHRKFIKRLDKLKEYFEALILEIKYLKKDMRLTMKLITLTINIYIGDYNEKFEKNKLLIINLTLRLIQDMINFINGSANRFKYKRYDKILNNDVETHIHEILEYIDDRRLDEYLENEFSEDEFSEYEYSGYEYLESEESADEIHPNLNWKY
ncbi:hypothetical protein DMUE_5144 [Dictyocoela muelleri]|nr:hypothetical protein DMUE_5144 [Dictyocoela muelleri]